MRNIFLLVKNYFLCGVGSLRGKKSKLKSSMGIVAITALYFAFFGLLLFSQIQSVKVYAQIDQQKIVLGLGFLMGIFLAVVFALQKVTGGQRANDAELLLAMPFKKSEIMVAKAVSRYLFNFVLVFLVVVPNIIAYMIYTPFTVVALLGNLLMLLMIPLFAVGLSYIVDFVMAFCFANSRYGNVIKAILTLLVLIAAVVIYEYIILNIEFGTMNWLIDGIITFNPIFMLVVIAVALGVFLCGVWLFSFTLSHETRSGKTKSFMLTSKRTTPFKSLFKNEVNRYLNSTALMINTLIGPIGILALTIWVLFDRGQTMGVIGASLGMPDSSAYLFITLVYSILVVMTYPAAFSISLEGKQFWVLKSMPIKTSTILLAKALFNVVLIAPITLVCTIIVAIVMKLSLALILTILLVPILLNLLVSFGGLFINLLFPKFEFESEAAVVKQSISGIVVMFGGMIAVVLLAILYFKLLSILPLTVALLIPILILLAVNAVLIVLTMTVGRRIFNKL